MRDRARAMRYFSLPFSGVENFPANRRPCYPRHMAHFIAASEAARNPAGSMNRAQLRNVQRLSGDVLSNSEIARDECAKRRLAPRGEIEETRVADCKLADDLDTDVS